MTLLEIIFGSSGVLLLVVWPLPFLVTAISLISRDSIKAPFGYHWLVLFTGWWACQLISGLSAGAVGMFNAPVVFTLQSVFLVLGFVWRKRVRKNNSTPSFSWVAPHRSFNTAEISTFFILLLVFLLGTYKSIKTPTSNFDSLAYHLPVMSHWVQQGNLWGFTEIGHVGLYPSHFDLLSTLFFFPWNSGLMIGFPSLLAWAYACLGLYVFIRLSGVKPTASILSVALFMLLPDLLERFGAIQPDLVLVAIWFCIAIALIRWIKHRHLLDLYFGLISLGLFLGMKLSAAGHTLLLVLFVGIYLWRTIDSAQIFPKTNRHWTILIFVLSTVLAGSWYVRNLIQTGNPAGLVQIEIMGNVIFPGTLERAELIRGSLANVFQVGSQYDWQILGSALWVGLGPAGVALLLLAGVGLGFKPKAGSLPRWIFLILLLGEATLYWTAPFSADNGSNGFKLTTWLTNGIRYGYIPVALLSVLAAKTIEKIRLQEHWPALALVVGCGLWSLKSMAVANPVALWVCITLALLVSLALNFYRWPTSRMMVFALGSGTLVLALLSAVMLPTHMANRTNLYGPVGQYLDDTGGNDAVMVVNSQELIRYAGQDWSRLVSVALPGKNIPTNAWLRELKSHGFRWLVLGTAGLEQQNGFVKQLVQDLDANNPLVELRLQESGLRKDERLYEIKE